MRDLKEGDGGCMAEVLAVTAMVFGAKATGILLYAIWRGIKPGTEEGKEVGQEGALFAAMALMVLAMAVLAKAAGFNFFGNW